MTTEAERVICFGDSMMLGLNTTPKGQSYVELLRDYYMNQLNRGHTPAQRSQKSVFYNLGVWNDKAPNLAKRVENEARCRIRLTKDDDPDVAKNLFVVGIGTNDAWVNTITQKPGTPMEDFSSSVEKIATTLAEMGRILHVGILACDEATVSKARGTDVPSLIERFVAYETKAVEIFRSVGAMSVPLAMASYYEPDFWPLGGDGVHCSDQGERWVFGQIKNAFGVMAGQSKCPSCEHIAPQ